MKRNDDENDVVELGDKPEIVAGNNFASSSEYGPFSVLKKLPEFEYFHARPDGDGAYAGTVGAQLFRGYEVDPTQKSLAHGHVLMRCPIEKWRKLRADELAETEAGLANPPSITDPEAIVTKDAGHGVSTGRRSGASYKTNT
jgi:hypothetical protein